jgi:uncharacterized protein (DUF2249 family)
MININTNTKIAAILKQHAGALDAIISISPKFEKLRNPILRKLMAGRATIAMASKIGGCSVNDFYEKLEPLGFIIDRETKAEDNKETKKVPQFLKDLRPEMLVELDVRPVIESGKDPLNIILEKIKTVQDGQVLKLINSFEPVPLLLLLGKQGFDSYVELLDENTVNTYFFKKKGASFKETDTTKATEGWEEMLQRFNGNMETIDVRKLEMPLPMLTILDALEKLPNEKALYVYHKRIPVFLLPELADRKFDYRIKEISDDEVHLLIFKA